MILRSVGMMTFINILKGAVSLLLSFYVAKAVSPAEFGLIAFAIPFATLITLLTDLGIANAVVRERNLSKVQSGSALTLMLGFGIFGSFTLALLATPIQLAADLPGVHDVVLGFSVVACFSVWATCPRALIERQLQYTTIGIVELTALVTATGGFFIAFHEGWGIFALVAFHIILQCVRSLVFLWRARQLFTWVLIPRDITPLLQTGGWIFGSNLLSYASRNLDRFIIAAHLGATAVGMYGFAYQFMTAPLVLLMSTLSRLDKDTESKKDVIEGFLAITSIIVFPMMTLIALYSSYPVNAFLPNSWHGVDRYIAMLAPLGAVQSIAVYASATLVADGRMRMNFKISILNGVLVPLGFLFSAPSGLLASLYVYLAINSSICALMIYQMCRTANINVKEGLILLSPGFAATSIIFAVGLIPANILSNSAGMQWLISTGTSIFGIVLVIFLFRSRLISHLKKLAFIKISKVSNFA
jgi:O-antigen/teichoic acid export membrane protein